MADVKICSKLYSTLYIVCLYKVSSLYLFTRGLLLFCFESNCSEQKKKISTYLFSNGQSILTFFVPKISLLQCVCVCVDVVVP